MMASNRVLRIPFLAANLLDLDINSATPTTFLFGECSSDVTDERCFEECCWSGSDFEFEFEFALASIKQDSQIFFEFEADSTNGDEHVKHTERVSADESFSASLSESSCESETESKLRRGAVVLLLDLPVCCCCAAARLIAGIQLFSNTSI